MNLNGLDIEYVSAQQANAREAFKRLSEDERDYWMRKAATKYAANCWGYFSKDGKDECALLEYIDSLPEPTVDGGGEHG